MCSGGTPRIKITTTPRKAGEVFSVCLQTTLKTYKYLGDDIKGNSKFSNRASVEYSVKEYAFPTEKDLDNFKKSIAKKGTKKVNRWSPDTISYKCIPVDNRRVDAYKSSKDALTELNRNHTR